jgi:hypothetical protein
MNVVNVEHLSSDIIQSMMQAFSDEGDIVILRETLTDHASNASAGDFVICNDNIGGYASMALQQGATYKVIANDHGLLRVMGQDDKEVVSPDPNPYPLGWAWDRFSLKGLERLTDEGWVGFSWDEYNDPAEANEETVESHDTQNTDFEVGDVVYCVNDQNQYQFASSRVVEGDFYVISHVENTFGVDGLFAASRFELDDYEEEEVRDLIAEDGTIDVTHEELAADPRVVELVNAISKMAVEQWEQEAKIADLKAELNKTIDLLAMQHHAILDATAYIKAIHAA